MQKQIKTSSLKYFLNLYKSSRGQSLAEFAVITAMMATFIATAIPKFSDVMESGKANKSIEELDKILLQAKNFYETTAALEGRGRLPGQDKFDMAVGGYTDSTDLLNDLILFDSFSDTALGKKWVSVFGFDNPDAAVLAANQSQVVLNRTEDPVDGIYPGETGYDLSVGNGSEEFLDLFGGEAIKSPFQDGHYIYTVVGGSGSGSQSSPPIIFVADLESPANFFKKLQP